MRRRGRRPMGRTLLTLAALVLVERRLRYGSRVPILPRRHEWGGLAREMAIRRFGIFTPTGIALRAGTRLLRRFGW
jgi:hypothetical protein